MVYLQGITGIIVLIGIAYAFSEAKRSVRIIPIVVGLLLQFGIALLLLKLPIFREFFLWLNNIVIMLENATNAGTSFVFGYLGGGTLPFDEKIPGASYIFAMRSLPLVLVISALSSVLFYWGILPIVVKGFSWLLQKTLGIGGAVGFCTTACIFLGMIESPLVIKPYLPRLTKSEIFTIMTCGMTSIAGTVMVLYSTILKDVIPGVLGHILTASIIHVPASITISRIMVPEGDIPTTGETAPPKTANSTMDAVAKGTTDGIWLFINIVAMLIVLIALVNLVNQILGLFTRFTVTPVTLQAILGVIMAPVCWLIGIPASEIFTAGKIMGTKIVLNEFLAFIDLSNLPKDALVLRSRLILTYAACSFANFGSLGILLGGLGSMVPERMETITAFGMRSILAGTIASCLTGAIVGLIC